MKDNNFDYKKYFEGKRVTKQGFGVLGRGFGVVKFLLECGAIVTVTDMKPENDFAEQIKELNLLIEKLKKEVEKNNNESGENEKYLGEVKCVLGEHRDEDFVNCDFVIQASGVPKDNYYLNLAKQNNISVYQESSLFVKLVKENFKDVKIIGVTGTRGKTTTTFLIYELLRKVKPMFFGPFRGSSTIHLGGNVQGVATLELISKIKEGDMVVMELDSWILQGFGDIKYSPEFSVFTSFMPDHMNYYKGDMKEYFLDKANIFLYQKEDDVFVTTNKVLENIKKYLGNNNGLTSQNVELVFPLVKGGDTSETSDGGFLEFETHLLGQHNQVAINLVYKIAKHFNITDDDFKNFVKDFKGVKGRLEFVKEYNGVKIYNDTCATTGDATVAGLNALEEELNKNLQSQNKIILICGGRDKELDMQTLINKFLELQNENKLEIILLSDETTTGTKKLLESIKQQNLQGEIKFIETKDLVEGLSQAISISKPGDKILFSPAFASFGMFKNEYDRGDKYMTEVNAL